MVAGRSTALLRPCPAPSTGKHSQPSHLVHASTPPPQRHVPQWSVAQVQAQAQALRSRTGAAHSMW